MSSLLIQPGSVLIKDNQDNVTFSTNYPMPPIRGVLSGSIAIGAPTLHSYPALIFDGSVLIWALWCKGWTNTNGYIGSIATYPNVSRNSIYAVPFFRMTYSNTTPAPVQGVTGEWTQGNSILQQFAPATDANTGLYATQVSCDIREVGGFSYVYFYHETYVGGGFVNASNTTISRDKMIQNATLTYSSGSGSTYYSMHRLDYLAGTLEYKIYLCHRI